MLLALVRFFCSVVAQLQHYSLQIMNYINWSSRRCRNCSLVLLKGRVSRGTVSSERSWHLAQHILGLPLLAQLEGAAPSRMCCSSTSPSRQELKGTLEKRAGQGFFQHMAARTEQWGFPVKLSHPSPLFFFLCVNYRLLRKSSISLYYTHGVGGRG